MSVEILYSPTERKPVISALERACADSDKIDVGESSALCERRGVDFLWRVKGRWQGVQRKELHDLLASFDDGRLAKEIPQMRAAVDIPCLVVEGKIRATGDGEVLTKGYGRGVSLSGLRKRLFTVRSMGCAVVHSDSIRDTGRVIVAWAEWTLSDGHSTAATRPKPTNDWGRLSNRDYQVHLLQGLPGVGVKTATDIVDTLGRCPLTLDATFEELCSVPGIGPRTARKLMNAVQQQTKEK